MKTVQILQFARHDVKKKFLSAPTITKLKIWPRQILSRFLDGPNKFCQSSASGPLLLVIIIIIIIVVVDSEGLKFSCNKHSNVFTVLL